LRGNPQLQIGEKWMRCATVFTAAIMVVAAGTAIASESGEGQMDSSALRKAVAGNTVHLATPMGGLPINYRTNGTMSGSAGTLASYVGSARDRGRWWIVADKLCQRWNTWLSGKSYCFRLRQEGATIHWTRNDGLSGVATIGRGR
jgi:hypothetical protein